MIKPLVTITLGLLASLCGAYPIDGYPYTGIRRLDFYSLAQQGIVPGRQLSAGAKYPLDRIRPRLVAFESLPTHDTDEGYNRMIRSYLGAEKDRYGVVVLDLSDPNNPIYAESPAALYERRSSIWAKSDSVPPKTNGRNPTIPGATKFQRCQLLPQCQIFKSQLMPATNARSKRSDDYIEPLAHKISPA